MKIADFGFKNSKRYVCEKPSYWKMLIIWTVVLYISPRKRNWGKTYSWQFLVQQNTVSKNYGKKEHCTEDEQISAVSVFERSQQRVPMKDFWPTRLKQTKKMIISKIDQNYGPIEDFRKFILNSSFMWILRNFNFWWLLQWAPLLKVFEDKWSNRIRVRILDIP